MCRAAPIFSCLSPWQQQTWNRCVIECSFHLICVILSNGFVYSVNFHNKYHNIQTCIHAHTHPTPSPDPVNPIREARVPSRSTPPLSLSLWHSSNHFIPLFYLHISLLFSCPWLFRKKACLIFLSVGVLRPCDPSLSILVLPFSFYRVRPLPRVLSCHRPSY